LKRFEDRKKPFSIKKEAATFKQELNRSEILPKENEAITKVCPQSKSESKAAMPVTNAKKPGRKSQCMESILRGSKTQT
jgi:hypothetical protein